VPGSVSIVTRAVSFTLTVSVILKSLNPDTLWAGCAVGAAVGGAVVGGAAVGGAAVGGTAVVGTGWVSVGSGVEVTFGGTDVSVGIGAKVAVAVAVNVGVNVCVGFAVIVGTAVSVMERDVAAVFPSSGVAL
jgi:hypothetical protein